MSVQSKLPLIHVIQSDRDFAAHWIVISPENARLIQSGQWDHHEGVQAAARHRLSQAASASGVKEAEMRDVLSGKMDAEIRHEGILRGNELVRDTLMVGDVEVAHDVNDDWAPVLVSCFNYVRSVVTVPEDVTTA